MSEQERQDLATRADIAEIGAEIRAGLELLAAGIRGAYAGNHAGTVQQVNVPAQHQPSPPPSRGERAAWAAAMAALIAITMVYMHGQRISDMRAAMTAEAAQRAAHEAWAREEANIIRGYIWTGKVPVANPYPKPEQPK